MGAIHKTVLLAGMLLATPAAPVVTPALAAPADDRAAAMTKVLDYLRNQNSTGFLVVQDGKVLVEKNWPAPEGNPVYANFVYGKSANGALLEDVASQQKSFVAVLIAIAADKGLVDVTKPVSAYLGEGWSKASPEQEARIRVIDVLTMSSGLTEKFAYAADPGTRFVYNTPVYAISKRIVAAAAKLPLDTITRDWLTAPLGMNDTAWRKRPAALASVGNDTGLVTTPRDTALFGLMVLHGGIGNDGKRIVSEAQLKALFERSATNPAYGRLWWLNGSEYTMRLVTTGAGGSIESQRKEGPLIAAAPADTVAALGAFDRRLYVVPSLKLVVVRTGAAAGDKDFDNQLWLRLMKAIG
ncbi:MAG: serine hydrolase [Sphingomonas sp.]|uniref:serine hydrolase domain-containing protein n=1 Tax=Sphingomonas sp. TaxID=28214 RepID=UPI0025F07FCF|nr:serine hydrolase [Sphingomonas sp.]MBX3564040.1 serine hydrolase [Sphingomonas sp.]